MKRFLCCLVSFVILVASFSVSAFAADTNKNKEIPCNLTGMVDYSSKKPPVLSSQAPSYFYLFDNGKPMYYSYDLLDDCQKKMYDTIVNAPIGTINFDFSFEYGEFPYSNFVQEYFDELMYAICNDHPEIFYYNGFAINDLREHDNTCIEGFPYTILFLETTTYRYSTVPGCYDDMINAMKQVPADLSNRYNFVKSVHDYLCETIYYPELNTPEYTGNAHDAYGALVEKVAVCQGYAEAFKMICDYYNIPCVTIYGTGVTTTGDGAHMWNAVQMDDGLWYFIDATWDDQTQKASQAVLQDFFLVGSDSVDTHFGGLLFSESHIADNDKMLPILKYANDKYAQTNHFTEFAATYNSIAKRDGNYLVRSYFDVYDSVVYYNGMYVEINSPATNSNFTVKSGVDGAEEEWTLVSVCDCNGDALADANDYAEAVNKVLSDTGISTAYDMAADADCDGSLDVIDLVIIERAVTGRDTNIVLE